MASWKRYLIAVVILIAIGYGASKYPVEILIGLFAAAIIYIGVKAIRKENEK
jgi:hypothetical protein